MLPIDPVLPILTASLAKSSSAVLVAPPGAGKTTRVPLALMGQDWVQGRKLILLEPRRLAARAAASRMAQSLGEKVGRTVGLRVRMQTEVSSDTRIEVVTEGVFTRMILSDPTLDGVAGVIFDEFHERSLDADLGLAFALDAQALLREDLRLLVMSATLDGAAVARLLNDAPVIESEGRGFPVETRYLGRDPTQRLEDQTARAVRRALDNTTGSVLVFLPGQGEIRRVQERLRDMTLSEDIQLAPLYGALTPAEQDAAIRPAAAGVRKVVLATSIAETSLTIEGVRVVIDCGLSRAPRYDPATGLTRLETVRVSRAAADQRRGRAGRTAPGVCYRLWDEAESRSLTPFTAPEILDSDLAGVALALGEWGLKDATSLKLLDPPPAGALSEARKLLTRLGALDGHGTLTVHGRRLARLGLPPRLGDMVVRGADAGQGERAALLAALLSERGLGGASTDLSERLSRFQQDRSPKAREAQAMADRWVRALPRETPRGPKLSDAALVAHAFPERIAQGRPGQAGEFRLANGRGARLDPVDPLGRSPWLAVAELVGGSGASDRIALAAPLAADELMAAFGDQMERRQLIETDAAGRVRVKTQLRIGELVVEERLVDRPGRALVGEALLARALSDGLDRLPWSEATQSLMARAAFVRQRLGEEWPDLGLEALTNSADVWLKPILEQAGRLDAISPGALHEAVAAHLDWEQARRLDRLAPARLETPAGTSHPIDYAADGGPSVEVRVQALFGLTIHPAILDGAVPLTLALTSPAHRPIQVTQDLPGFWKGSWKAVKAEMKGRYPRHPWPDDPSAAAPTVRAKPRGT